MEFHQPVPILRIFDEFKAKEFYLDFLEFKVDWEYRFADDLPVYFQVTKGACSIHLSEHFGDCSPGAAIRIATLELEKYQQYLLAKQYKNARPGIENQPWGTREMVVRDPFHNRLIFFETMQT